MGQSQSETSTTADCDCEDVKKLPLTQNKEGVDSALLPRGADSQAGVRPRVVGPQPQQRQRAAFRGHAATRDILVLTRMRAVLSITALFYSLNLGTNFFFINPRLSHTLSHTRVHICFLWPPLLP